MRVTGTATLAVPAETVRAALGDRDLLARAIPGCERLDVTGAGRCQLTVRTAIAAVNGTYAGEAAIVERQDPGLIGGPAGGPAGGLVVATVSAAGNRGSASAKITVRLAPAGEGATQVSYDVDATVTGAMAGIGQRMLASIASRLAAEFLAALGGLLSEPAAVEVAAVKAPAAEAPVVEAPAAEAPAAEAPVVEAPVVEAPVVEPMLVESMVVGPTVVQRPAEAAADLDQPRAGPSPAVRAGVLAGGAVGLAGILIGAVLGRRNRAAGRGSR
ncbi:MAG TPA: SRPBCC domain-containing protein [Streptosporangiaceae bacterium]|nr:SRPBCC domain-containing protein [Streptosporangiaceae bacterium]